MWEGAREGEGGSVGRRGTGWAHKKERDQERVSGCAWAAKREGESASMGARVHGESERARARKHSARVRSNTMGGPVKHVLVNSLMM